MVRRNRLLPHLVRVQAPGSQCARGQGQEGRCEREGDGEEGGDQGYQGVRCVLSCVREDELIKSRSQSTVRCQVPARPGFPRYPSSRWNSWLPQPRRWSYRSRWVRLRPSSRAKRNADLLRLQYRLLAHGAQDSGQQGSRREQVGHLFKVGGVCESTMFFGKCGPLESRSAQSSPCFLARFSPLLAVELFSQFGRSSTKLQLPSRSSSPVLNTLVPSRRPCSNSPSPPTSSPTQPPS